jgi:hypothetical protein
VGDLHHPVKVTPQPVMARGHNRPKGTVQVGHTCRLVMVGGGP